MRSMILSFLFALQTVVLQLGGQSAVAEIADEPNARAEGLKKRKNLPLDHGMLFIFEKPEIATFWMEDTLIPLSIAFFDKEKSLINIEDMHLPKEGAPLPVYQSRSPALYALEMPLHWFREHGIAPGMKFSFQEASR